MDSLGDRMKRYEDVFRNKVNPRQPLILRIDGKCFHSVCRGLKKPFDEFLGECMDKTALRLLDNIQNARFAYVQSDEISILLIDYNRFDSQQWFDGNIQKMVSISGSIASVEFTKHFGKDAFFDSRVIPLPENEVVNYFVWRQQDATRNSISMVAQSLYSHKELHKKNSEQQQQMIFEKGVNWNDYPAYWKRGRCVSKGFINKDIPIFTKEREYIERFMGVEQL